MTAESPLFGCFTLQQASPATTVFLSDIGQDGQPARKRKVHTKSRLGCAGCKARKVKCDEEQPCRGCVRRNQECIRCYKALRKPNSSIHTQRQHSPRAADSSPPRPALEVAPMNQEHLRLLHHFEAFTSKTFIMEPETWKHAVIKLALQNEFLMHAIFLVTATHLQHLQPHETKHRIVALQNLSQALPGFRNAIDNLSGSKEYSMEMAEALIACSLLLLQYSWNFDSEVWNRDESLTGLYRGLMAITLLCLDEVREGSLSPMLRFSPRLHIEQRMRIAGTAYKVDDVLLHILSCTKISNIQPENPRDFLDPIERLNSILWALDLDRNRSADLDLELPAARYLFNLPNWLPDGFIQLVKMNDGRAQTLLLYMFAAVSRLRSERFWWMRKRALYLFEEISLRLGNRCVECTSRAHEIFRRED